MTFRGPVGELIHFAIGGGWGSEVPKEMHSRVAVIRGTDIPKLAAGNFSTVPFRFESDKKIVTRLLSPGDVVLETAGGSSANGQYTGRTLLITQEILDTLGPTICASFCKKIVLNKELVNPAYFYFYMQDFYNSGRVASYDSQSTGISNFQYEAFVKNEILELPSKEIQSSIGVTLQNLDKKINANSQISQTLERLARTIFKSWFIDFDPVKAKMAGEKPLGMNEETASLFPDSMMESENGLIPEGWNIVKVEDLLSRLPIKGLPKSTDLSNSGRTLVLEQGNSVIAGFVDQEADVLASTDAPKFVFGDHTCRMRLSTLPFSVFPNTIVLESRMVNTYWAFHATNCLQRFETYRRHWMELAYKLVTVPTVPLAEAFGSLVSPLYAQIDALMLESRTLVELRDAALQRLISGELRIPDVMVFS